MDWASKRQYRPGWARRARAALERRLRPSRPKLQFCVIVEPGVGSFIRPVPNSGRK